MNDLEKELAALMIDELNPEDIRLDTLTAGTPLYGKEFGLDFINILEAMLLISKKYGFELCSGGPDNRKVFASLGPLVAYVAEHRIRQARTSTRRVPLSVFDRTDTTPVIGAFASHLVLIPGYNPDHKVDDTVRSARAQWNPVWVAVDGSADGSTERSQAMAAQDPGLQVIVSPRNRDKGVAVLVGPEVAAAASFTYVLTMDTDGQHPANLTSEFMTASQMAPDTVILGQPVFDATAPQMRVQDRRPSNGYVDIETLWTGIGGTLFSLRVYPITLLAKTMHQQSWIRSFGFDLGVVVRLCWADVRPIRLMAPVRYFRLNEGGMSHFQYLHDSILPTAMHLRLAAEGLLRLPSMIARRLQCGWQSTTGGLTLPLWRPWPGTARSLWHVRPVTRQTDHQSRRRRPRHP